MQSKKYLAYDQALGILRNARYAPAERIYAILSIQEHRRLHPPKGRRLARLKADFDGVATDLSNSPELREAAAKADRTPLALVISHGVPIRRQRCPVLKTM